MQDRAADCDHSVLKWLSLGMGQASPKLGKFCSITAWCGCKVVGYADNDNGLDQIGIGLTNKTRAITVSVPIL